MSDSELPLTSVTTNNNQPQVTPIYHTANYLIQDCDSVYKQISGGYVYSRLGNPNTHEVEKVIAKAEGGVASLVYCSGQEAISNTMMCLLRPGDHLITQRIKYNGTDLFLKGFLASWNIEITEVRQPLDNDMAGAFAAATQPNTKVYFIESPTNPTTWITDFTRLSEAAAQRGILTVVDSTLASPINQQPLRYGIDVVLHSCTKYMSGHSDLTAGCAVFNRQDLYMKMLAHRTKVSGPLNPADSALLLRSLRTLHIRVKQHNENAMAVAEFLEGHAKVTRVLYPGLSSHPQHELAKKQMKGFGGVVSVVFATADEAKKFIGRLKLFHLAASHGSVSCSVIHSGIMAHNTANISERNSLVEQGLAEGLVRLSIGIEDIDDILNDLLQALQAL